MIFLDANALYWYYGIDKLDFGEQSGVDSTSLREFIDLYENGVAIPSTCYVEVLSHFKSQPIIARNIVNFIHEKNILIYNNSLYISILPGEVEQVLTYDYNDLNTYLTVMRKNKKDTEVKFSIMFFDVIQLLYLRNIIENKIGNTKTEAEKERMLSCIANFIKQHWKEDERKFINALDAGYLKDDDRNNKKSTNAESMLKNVYINALYDIIFIQNMFVELYIEMESEEPDLVECIKKSGNRLIKKLDSENGEMKQVKASFFNKKDFEKIAQEEICLMLQSRKILPYQALYIKEVMMSSWIDSAAKLKKNDIFDMLCLGCLNAPKKEIENVLIDNSNYLITFDEKMRDFIKKHFPANDTLISKFVIQ